MTNGWKNLENLLAQAADDLREVVPPHSRVTLSSLSGSTFAATLYFPSKRKERTLKGLLDQVEGLAARHRC